MIGPRRPPGGRTGRRSMPGTYRVVAAILAPVVRALVRRSYRGLEHVPPEGPALVCVNHIGAFDPLCFALALWDNDTPALFLGKAGIVRAPVVGPILRSAGIVPVDRETSRADEAFGAAVTLLRRGRVIGIYPEGSFTRDPDLWPMRGKTGAARLALKTRAPVIPVAQWGAQDVVVPYARRLPRFLPRRTIHVHAGPAVDLSDLYGREVTREVANEATDRIMAAITALLEEVRGESAPAVRFDPKAHGLPAIGRYDRTAARREARR